MKWATTTLTRAAFLWPLYLTLCGVAGMPQKWGVFVAQVTKLVSGRPSKSAALAQ